MVTNGNQKTPENAEKRQCETCDFECCKNSEWQRHISTLKHKNGNNGNKNGNNGNKKTPKNALREFECGCGSSYVYRTGLSRHKKKCKNVQKTEKSKNDVLKTEKIINGELTEKELMLAIVKQNSELISALNNGAINNYQNNNITQNNSHNKTFNLNIFLNEECKDAMNIGEFVSSIKMDLDDLETTGRLGYVEGISKIIINNLNSLGTHERPIHCSDSKREILYIKDNNTWLKEDDENDRLTKVIKVIANQNIKQIINWQSLNPDCCQSESKKNKLYLKIVSNAMSGSSKEESSKNINKIISNLAKKVIIEK